MRSYDVTAEFYDVLHASRYVRSTRRVLDRWLGTPTVGVIDVGAGTGLGTSLLTARCHVDVHAVEPSRAMRAVLLSRLAGQPDVLSRVHVHTCLVQDLNLHRAADFVLCLNTMGTLDREARAAALAALHRAVVPGGRLVVEAPPARLPTDVHQLPSWTLGDQRYGGTVSTRDAGAGRFTWHFDYRVTNGDALVRSEHESFPGYLVPDFEPELTDAGFAVTERDGDLFIASRVHNPAG
jgi:SAM-dependent methyltransferase